jgi:hypothetical protein
MPYKKGRAMKNKEPAVIGTAVAAVISAVTLIVFGQELDKTQEAAIVGVVTILAGLFVRSQVSPVP